ncbi:hypothetical protein E6C60_2244 [Paenibacillus algicola]|uniref:Uncharacterized protein n=1 Tax=Paenibacillus algicola TaxID=2565926 RepID=A0A4P8XJW5_9BACL|nr:hypothetical protein E6C60_2244 [Paenibacillus algicola]
MYSTSSNILAFTIDIGYDYIVFSLFTTNSLSPLVPKWNLFGAFIFHEGYTVFCSKEPGYDYWIYATFL